MDRCLGRTAKQAKQDYYDYLKNAVEESAGIYTWGIQDGLDTGWRTEEQPLPGDKSLEKKPTYYGI